MNKEESKNQNKRVAVIKIRGAVAARINIKDTFGMLRLYRKNYCVVVENNPCYLGMIRKIKDYVTWGEIEDDTYESLIEKKGELYKGRETDAKGKIKYKKFVEINGKKIKPFFRLPPPKKGFGRNGIKTVFSKGGALGYRGAKINELIKRML